MAKTVKEPFGFDKIFCGCCGKFLPDGVGFNFFTGACEKCSKKIVECKICGRKLAAKQKWKVRSIVKQRATLCELCGGCPACCNCSTCHKCGKVIIGSDGHGFTCWSCSLNMTTLIESFMIESKTKKPRIEAYLMKFYMLEFIDGIAESLLASEMARIKARVEESELRELRRKIRPVLGNVIDLTAEMFLNYLVGAVAGESRYLCKNSACSVGNGLCGGELTRAAAIEEARVHNPKKLLMLMSVAFEASHLGGSIGGPKWANIAKVGLMYFNGPKKIFLDHVVDLTHNGGLFLGKTGHFFYFEEAPYMGILDLKKSGKLMDSSMPVLVDEETEEIMNTAIAMKIVPQPEKVIRGTLGAPVKVEYGSRVPLLREKHYTFFSKEQTNEYLEKISKERWDKLKEEFWEGVTIPKVTVEIVGLEAAVDAFIELPPLVLEAKGDGYVKVKA